ncbi:Uncharacterised protein [Alcaligenes faecalis]|nr:hypothetical protein CPY64_13065 [Alcaligenes faecalis]GAU75180.1 hypothetical protein AFA2_03537 [Alcaligenes faecalis subsp. faecalis NBRC 13111]CUI84306.1 Uncharacterised protein [Alcaligenes faecalis]
MFSLEIRGLGQASVKLVSVLLDKGLQKARPIRNYARQTFYVAPQQFNFKRYPKQSQRDLLRCNKSRLSLFSKPVNRAKTQT